MPNPALEARLLMANYSETFTASVPSTLTDFNQMVTLPKFNPIQGTLTEVDLTFNTSGTQGGTLTNVAAGPETFQLDEDVNILLQDAAATPLLSVDQTSTQAYVALASGATASYGPFTPAQSGSATFVSGATFDEFAGGPGSIPLTVATSTNLSQVGGGGNIRANLTTTVAATATVTYRYSANPVTLSGTVYDDVNGTGTLAAGDLPIPGTTLTLFNSAGTAIATTTTNADGTYLFTTSTDGTVLPADTYTIAETQPGGYLQGSNTVGTVNGATDGTLPSLDVIGSIALTQGQNSIGNNFGEVLPVSISGTVYDDVNGTGTLSTGDLPIPGTVLTLVNTGGAVVATTTTSATGTYSFTTTTAGAPLPPGTYQVDETQPAPYLQGSNTVGTVNGVTDGSLPGVDQIGSIVLTSGQASIGNNFGEILPASISGTVYDDVNGTGVLGAGDLPIPGTTLTLVNGSGVVVATTTTSATGTYSFTTTTAGAPLPPGTYLIGETQPAGYLQGSNTVGTVNGVPDGNLPGVDLIGSIVLGSNQSSIGNNFGEVLPVSISGTVYQDVNGTGTLSTGDLPIPGTVLTLVNPAGVVVATTTTSSVGTYSFSTTASGAPLPPGTYQVDETQPAGFLQGTNTVGTVNGATDGRLTGLDQIGSIVLTSSQNSIGNNFGEILPVSLSGTVYYDALNAGVLLPGDTPIVGVTVTLANSTGVVATATTNAFGVYSFTTNAAGAPLAPGTYSITETQPAGFLQGTNTVGNVNGTTVGVIAGTDVIGSIGLKGGQSSVANNFGEILTPPTPFHVTNIQRFGVHLQPTLILISFDAPLNPAQAQNIATYQIVGPTDSKHPTTIPIDSAVYNASSQTVTLNLGARLQVHHPYRLSIIGLTDTSGVPISASSGEPIGVYEGTVSRTNLAGFTDIYGNFIPINHGQLYPAAIASGYQLKKFVQPTNLGSFAAANKAAFQIATSPGGQEAPIAHQAAKAPAKGKIKVKIR